MKGGCQITDWTREPGKYGTWGYSHKRSIAAHRHAWERAHGPIPKGMCVLHHCDNPGCVNIDHLFLGTRGDNNRDRAAKGRSAMGDRHGLVTTPDWALPYIRALHASGEFSYSQIARAWGTSPSSISRYIRGTSRAK